MFIPTCRTITFSVVFIVGGDRSLRREPPTCDMTTNMCSQSKPQSCQACDTVVELDYVDNPTTLGTPNK